jgi:hypothetical protein
MVKVYITSPLPASAILGDPAAYNGKHVRVCGLLKDSLETCRLLVGQGDVVPGYPHIRTIPPSMWLNGPNGCAPGNPNPKAGEPIEIWVVAEGTFFANGSFGHLGAADHQLNATSIEPIGGPCDVDHGA